MSFNPEKTALLIVDLQNDFLHPEGAYGRAGQGSSDIAALPEKLLPLLDTIRAKGGWIISTQFTLIAGKGGEPFIASHLKKLRPFLKRGDFQSASWGNSLVDMLQPADIVIEKVAYSAFYQSRLEFALNRAGIDTLMVCGIVTNGGVSSTVRDAHVRDIHTITVEDGCAAFDPATHKIAIDALRTVGEVITIQDAIAKFEA